MQPCSGLLRQKANNMMHRKSILFISCIALVVCAAYKEISVEAGSIFKVPSNFPQPVYHFKTNPVTQAGFELGRTLFYDPGLSRDSTVSCGACHIQSSAFTHHGHDISHGVDGLLTTRNAPPIMNLAWSTSFMQDGGVADLDLQPLVPITSHVEMDCTTDTIVKRLQKDPAYPAMFKKAFNTSNITSANVLKALSQFILMCVSSNSKYDSVMRNEAVFTKDENAGYLLFKQKCDACHTEPLFTDYSYRDNGIAIGQNKDAGRYNITLQDSDKYKFKVPSLRNLAYTNPYMHNGQVYQLKSVLEQYRFYTMDKPNLDPLLKQNGKPGIPMTNAEEKQLLAFLQTLNDHSFITNKMLADPGTKKPKDAYY